MIFKDGVKLLGISPEITAIFPVIAKIWMEMGQTLVITSVCDGKHSENSLHYSGRAIDCRTRYFSTEQKQELLQRVKMSLTDEFDVVLEDTHLHIEFDPK
jgi:hypothetical protein